MRGRNAGQGSQFCTCLSLGDMFTAATSNFCGMYALFGARVQKRPVLELSTKAGLMPQHSWLGWSNAFASINQSQDGYGGPDGRWFILAFSFL